MSILSVFLFSFCCRSFGVTCEHNYGKRPNNFLESSSKVDGSLRRFVFQLKYGPSELSCKIKRLWLLSKLLANQRNLDRRLQLGATVPLLLWHSRIRLAWISSCWHRSRYSLDWHTKRKGYKFGTRMALWAT